MHCDHFALDINFSDYVPFRGGVLLRSPRHAADLSEVSRLFFMQQEIRFTMLCLGNLYNALWLPKSLAAMLSLKRLFLIIIACLAGFMTNSTNHKFEKLVGLIQLRISECANSIATKCISNKCICKSTIFFRFFSMFISTKDFHFFLQMQKKYYISYSFNTLVSSQVAENGSVILTQFSNTYKCTKI